MTDKNPMASAGPTIEQMRADIADVLQEGVESIVAGENLVDVGLDSIRIMTLAERWSAPGARIEFEDLAAYPELNHWREVVGRRHAAASK
jgi:aryl carrier-like protein